METILFTNWTDEDFIGLWDGITYPIKKGQSMYLEDWKAKHFAKHLVDREMNKEGKPTSNPMRIGLEAKCFGESEEVKSEVEIENLNKQPSEVSSEIAPQEKTVPAEKVDKRTKGYKQSQEKFEGLKD